MRSSRIFFTLVPAFTALAKPTHVLTDINEISKYWGNLRPYADNPENYFGVEYTGLPDGCQVVGDLNSQILVVPAKSYPQESVQTYQRHGERTPYNGSGPGRMALNFEAKLSDFISTHPNHKFTGPLKFLNSWRYIIENNGLLTGIGAVAEVDAGVKFWNQYGRILYNASFGQLAYDSKFPNGTDRPPVVLRTTEQSRIQNSQINWALGFFGSSIQRKPDQEFTNVTQPFKVVIIPEETNEKSNNTLASYVSCTNLIQEPTVRRFGNVPLNKYSQEYLGEAIERLKPLAPDGFNLTIQDVQTMQLLCPFETSFIGASEFCSIFTEDEWASFDHSMDIKYYYRFSYGNPTGRAQGLGYVQEILARLSHSLITSSSSSLNSTLDGNPETFPTNQAFYADFTHDVNIISVLTALSIDYFHEPPNLTQYPPNPDRKFILSRLTPFGSRLITESIGCSSPDPEPRKNSRIQYRPEQYGYDASKANHKFVRMRLNNGIIPLNTIRGGACGNTSTGRVDGMCGMENFFESQKDAARLANYEYACFGNYTIDTEDFSNDFDGTISA